MFLFMKTLYVPDIGAGFLNLQKTHSLRKLKCVTVKLCRTENLPYSLYVKSQKSYYRMKPKILLVLDVLKRELNEFILN